MDNNFFCSFVGGVDRRSKPTSRYGRSQHRQRQGDRRRMALQQRWSRAGKWTMLIARPRKVLAQLHKTGTHENALSQDISAAASQGSPKPKHGSWLSALAL